ncbi:MAG: protoheme IX farnesyltransferase [Flavisolibacter sp.]|jgi:protoheme IX farnesyltransferase|nr:protoheme IX farnesyltransferase [Flavisolibacter sp.]
MGHDEVTARKNNKLRDYLQLTKPSLNIMVVFSSVVCYLLAPKVVEYDWVRIALLFVGGFLVTGSANAINQAVEKDTDAVMKRTASRPVASGRMDPAEAWTFAILTGMVGITILGYFFNWQCAALATLSLFLYAFVYTPLKKVNAIAVLIGAFPGALPCLIGWSAGNDSIFDTGNGWKDYGGWILFGIQFLWQFPHFWAIAWIAHKDYSGAGFKLLPSEKGPTKFTALQTIIYALLLIPVCTLPYLVNLTGSASLIVVMMANIFLIIQCIRLYRSMDSRAARRVMFSSYIYLPIVFLALLSDKIPNAASRYMGFEINNFSSLFFNWM